MNKENLYKAIELAADAGNYQYKKNNQPCCVIAQLINLEGGDINMIDDSQNMVNILHLLDRNDHVRHVLKDYPDDLLDCLQMIWDEGDVKDDPKGEMRSIVDSL